MHDNDFLSIQVLLMWGSGRRTLRIGLCLALGLGVMGCSQQADEQTVFSRLGIIQIDGSSTVYPITEAVAEEFQLRNRGQARVIVGVSGTGGGFKKLCRGELDIANASRPIQKAEMSACAQAGIEYFELPIAYDALTVAVHPQNPLSSITLDQLAAMWGPKAQNRIKRWNQVHPEWPDRPLTLYGAGADSGTFDYFTEAVVGKAKSSRGDFTASEDDNVLVQGISTDVGALGYFGFAYYEENRDRLKALAIQARPDQQPVLPTVETVIDGTYAPLARPLFIYVSSKAWRRPEVQTFLGFYLAHAAALAREVRYIPLPDFAYRQVSEHLHAGKVGTVFHGEPATAITIEQLLKRESSL